MSSNLDKPLEQIMAENKVRRTLRFSSRPQPVLPMPAVGAHMMR